MSIFKQTLGWQLAQAEQRRRDEEARTDALTNRISDFSKDIAGRLEGERSRREALAIKGGESGLGAPVGSDEGISKLAMLGQAMTEQRRLVAKAKADAEAQKQREALAAQIMIANEGNASRKENAAARNETIMDRQAAADTAAWDRLVYAVEHGKYANKSPTDTISRKVLATMLSWIGKKIATKERALTSLVNNMSKTYVESQKQKLGEDITKTKEELDELTGKATKLLDELHLSISDLKSLGIKLGEQTTTDETGTTPEDEPESPAGSVDALLDHYLKDEE